MQNLINNIIYYFFPLMVIIIGILLEKFGYFSNIGFSPKYYWILVVILIFYYFITLMIAYESENPDTNEGDKNLPTYI